VRCPRRARYVSVEALTVKSGEIQENRRREPASVHVARQPRAQDFARDAGVSPELDRDDDVAEDPLEEKALENAGLALESFAIGARGGCSRRRMRRRFVLRMIPSERDAATRPGVALTR
jgi:hypothetical protein